MTPEIINPTEPSPLQKSLEVKSQSKLATSQILKMLLEKINAPALFTGSVMIFIIAMVWISTNKPHIETQPMSVTPIAPKPSTKVFGTFPVEVILFGNTPLVHMSEKDWKKIATHYREKIKKDTLVINE